MSAILHLLRRVSIKGNKIWCTWYISCD